MFFFLRCSHGKAWEHLGRPRHCTKLNTRIYYWDKPDSSELSPVPKSILQNMNSFGQETGLDTQRGERAAGIVRVYQLTYSVYQYEAQYVTVEGFGIIC